MKNYIAYFTDSSGYSEDSKISSFWIPLVTYFIEKADSFRVDCWINEKDAIKRALQFGKLMPVEIKNIRTIEGAITEEFVNELIYNSKDEEGKVKWFSVFLRNHTEQVFSSEHYGSEFITGFLNDKDITFLKNMSLKEICFHVYNGSDYLNTVDDL